MISAVFLLRQEDSNLRPTGYELRPGCAFCSFRGVEAFQLGTKILFGPVYSIGSVQSKSRMGHGLGQKEGIAWVKG